MKRVLALCCGVLMFLAYHADLAHADDISTLPGGMPTQSNSADLGPEPPAIAGQPGLTEAQSAAVIEAKRLNTPVEVTAEADDRTKVMANPDGTVDADYSVEPFRHLENTRWVDGYDPVPEPIADRTPGAGPSMVLGSVPVAGGKFLDVSWPDALPTRQVKDNYAIYPEVRPGVDLVVSHASSGIGTYFVVKNAEAAAALQAEGQRLGAHGEGLQVVADGDGFAVRDANGASLYQFDPFEMWDASGFDGDPTDVVGLVQSGFQAKRALMNVTYSDGEFTLKPNQDFLADPTVTYPLVMDPWFPVSFSAAQSFTLSNRGLRMTSEGFVGFNGYPKDNGAAPSNDVWRTFVSFHLGSTLRGAQVRDAKLRMYGTHSPNLKCKSSLSNSTVQLYRVGAFGSGTRWANQPGVTSGVLSANPDAVGNWRMNCPSREMEWGVGNVVQEAANNGTRGLYFMLRSNNESEKLGWRRFGFKLGYPRLTLSFGRAPNIPTQIRVAGVSKVVPDGSALPQTLVPGGRIQLQALVSHPDGRRLRLAVYVRNSKGEEHVVSGPVNSGEWATVAIDKGSGAYWVSLQAYEDGQDAFWSGKSAPVMRLFPVGAPPTPQVLVNSSMEMGTGTTLTFGAGGTATSITYLVDGRDPKTIGLVNGKATVSWTPAIDGPHTITAYAQNVVDVRAGSADQVVMARAKGSERKGYWGFDGDLSNKDSASAPMQLSPAAFENVVPWDDSNRQLKLSPGVVGEATGLIIPPQKTVSLVGVFKPDVITGDCSVAGVRSTSAGNPVYVVLGVHNQRFAGGVLSPTGLVWADDNEAAGSGVAREVEIRLDRAAAKLSVWVKGLQTSSVDVTVDEITSGAVKVGNMQVGSTSLPACTGGLDWLSVWTNGAVPAPTPNATTNRATTSRKTETSGQKGHKS